MSESSRRNSRALKRQEKILNLQDWSWKIWKPCDICGNDFCVNCQWEDRKPRTPKFKGFVICAGCDPRSYEGHFPGDKIMPTRRGRAKYKVVMALHLVSILAKRPCERGEDDCGKCLSCGARKLTRIKL